MIRVDFFARGQAPAPFENSDAVCCVLWNGEFPSAALRFRVTDGRAELLSLEERMPVEGLSAADVLVRAALNRAEHCGAKSAFCADASLSARLIQELGFAPEETGCALHEISALFAHPCQTCQ